jgi:hypothetical protein
VKNKERRTRTRLRLRLPVFFLRSEDDGPLQTETVDISNNGFYCITPHPFAPGERLACVIGIPVRSGPTLECKDQLCLQAEVEVVRIVVTNDNGFGVGCRISDYRVLAGDSLPSWANSQAVLANSIEQLV